MIAVAVATHISNTFGDLTYSSTASGGNVFIDWMPDAPDIAVAVMTGAGRPQGSKLPTDYPAIQILVRGAPYKSLDTYAMARRIYSELQCLDGVTLAAGGPHEVHLVGCTADQSDPVSMGRDVNQRPEYSLNFSLHVSAPTTHRPAVNA